MINPLRIYHSLPYPLRSFATSIYGRYLYTWRYGPDTEKMVQNALEREQWSYSKWKEWQEEKLNFVLYKAINEVPYYKQQWSKRRQQGDKASWEYLENWPILGKETLRQTPLAFLSETCNPRKMYSEHTSGTTGKPLQLWWSKKTVQSWFALFEARWRQWYGVTKKDRWAIIGGRIIKPFEQKRPPFWIWNEGLNQLYFSAFHISLETVESYIAAFDKYKITYLIGYPSAMYSLAKIAIQNGLKPPHLKFILSNAETLFPNQRDTISKFFDCPIYNSYGMAEIVAAASECQNGSLHIWPEVGIIEVSSSKPNEGSELTNIGKFICTGLLNQDMPLIRYDIGDVGTVSDQYEVCKCKREMPVIKEIEGRWADTVITVDGRRIGRLAHISAVGMNVRELQVIQEDYAIFRVLVVPAQEFTGVDEQRIIHHLQERIGKISVFIEIVDQIPRTSNGKFRSVISKINNGSSGLNGNLR